MKLENIKGKVSKPMRATERFRSCKSVVFIVVYQRLNSQSKMIREKKVLVTLCTYYVELTTPNKRMPLSYIQSKVEVFSILKRLCQFCNIQSRDNNECKHGVTYICFLSTLTTPSSK